MPENDTPIAQPEGAPAAGSKPPAAIDRKHPLDWHKTKADSYPTLCLAAALHGWDYTGNDLRPMPEAEYDAAIRAAVDKLVEVRRELKARREKDVVILPHSSLLHAVIFRRPTGMELRGFIMQIQSDAIPDAQKLEISADFCAQHIAFPAEGTAERQDLMDDLPGAFFFDYPNQMRDLVGLTGGEVKKRA